MIDLETIVRNAPKDASPEDLAAYLDEACGDDAELRARADGYFAVWERIDDVLETETLSSEATGPSSGKSHKPLAALAAAEASQPISEKEGDRVGPYKLLQKIGEGGFGVVWMAEQSEPISRKVAVKVVKAGMDTREVPARFEAERQALAMMDHPNIARVIDAGSTKGGRPYFAMELVKGIPITTFCDEQKLDTRLRLELFRDVCSAVNHAHQKGIIHRDLKPSNVMVTLHGDKAVVKVIDFGIAKATQNKLTDKTLFTRFEQFVGTPVYMSPEQAAMSGLDIDTRSDIYSLGVLLYELLVGRPPFDPKTLASGGYDEMRRIIREKEPLRPSRRLDTMAGEESSRITSIRGTEPGKLQGLLKGDLDWIVMKAIEKDRSRRYETANALSADIGRHLENEPVLAAAPSAAYTFRKFALRNKVAFGVGAVIAAVLVMATAVSAWQAVRATRSAKRAAGAEALATTRLAESEQARVEANRARAQSDRARKEAEAIAAFLTDIFQSPNPNRDGRTVTVAETLAGAAGKLDTDLADQPDRKAQLQTTLGRTYNALGLFDEAAPLFESARDLREKAHGPEHPETLAAMNLLAIAYSNSGRRDEALALRKALVDSQRKLRGPEHPSTLSAQYFLAKSFYNAGRRDEALTLGEEVLDARRKVLGPEHRGTLLATDFLAQVYSEAGREKEALALREEVLQLRQKLDGPRHPGTLQATRGLAKSYFQAGRNDAAHALREEVIELSREILGPEHPDTLRDRLNLARSHDAAGRKDKALAMREHSLALFQKISGPRHPDTLRAMHDLARSYEDAGRPAEALELREDVFELRRKILGSEHRDTLEAMQPLAHSYSAAGRWDEALAIRRDFLELNRKLHGRRHEATLAAMAKLAHGCEQAGRKEEAAAIRRELADLEAGPR